MYKAVKHKEVEGLSHLPPQELKNEVQAWLASFTPLVMNREAHTESEVMQRLGLILELKKNGPLLKMRLGDMGYEEQELADTFRRAWEQLPSLENDTRLLLGKIRPGDPRGLPDLDALQDRLDEREARQEIGAPTTVLPDSVVEETASPKQVAAAIAQLSMAGGVLAFTTFHMIAMIWGMSQAFGPLAFLLVFFYSIFYFGAFAMVSSAFKAGAEEKVKLNGRTLTITRTLGPIEQVKDFVIAPNSLPRIGRPNLVVSSKNGQMPQTAILLTEVTGKEVSFGMGMTHEMRERLRDKISTYLKAQG